MTDYNYFVPGDNEMKQESQKKFWDSIYKEIFDERKYDKLYDILTELRDLTLVLAPNRTTTQTKKQIQDEFLEHVDVDFFKQQFENNVFDQDNFIELFSYWIDWAKKFGAPEDDNKMDNLLERIKSETSSNGFFYMLPYAYYSMYSQLNKVYTATCAIRQQLDSMKN